MGKLITLEDSDSFQEVKGHWDHYLSNAPIKWKFKLYIYATPPIDDWEAFRPFREWVLSIGSEPHVYGLWDRAIGYHQILDVAMRLAKDFAGWEGDFESVQVCPDLNLKDSNCPDLILLWKQDNNGTTFIASPSPLDSQKEYLCCSLIDNKIQRYHYHY